MPNRLATETSPYLLQHAHNPVDWYPWCDEAFEKARLENKPVLVSIGYAACHWCHVMERESFENEEVAALMNQHFVNIKVDREERPDVDHIYMDAVQAISGSGGWPLNVFLTPERRPFYGGTYFPPKRAFNRPSWTELLQSIAHSFKEKRDEVEEQATNLTQHLKVSNDFGVNSGQAAINEALVEEAFVNIMKTADKEWGGFGRAPKFPQTFTISFLLQYAHFTGNEQAKTQALLSLDKMMEGGIYDQVGGGFARYSTDTEWLAPHFEKMLYDNALLVQVLADAYLMTKDERYRRVMEETLAFVERELTHEQGGFYSALDADSEGVEGKFYVWELDEVIQLLGEDADLFCRYYDITEKGNWEGKNILRIPMPLAAFAIANDKDEKELAAIMDRGRKILLEARGKRIRPALDDKIILGWNALMNIAYSKAYAATGNVHFLQVAEKNIRFLMESYQGGNGLLHHSWKNGEARHPAFLDDYAGFIAALTELAQVSADFGYFGKARELVNTVLDNFGDEASPFFLYTHKGQQDVLIRKKEVYDGATPSGNALMAGNLHKLSQVYDEASWRERSEAMTGAMAGVAGRYPGSFGLWLAVIYEQLKGTKEIALVGKEAKNYLVQTLGIFIPYKLIMASSTASESWPLLAGKEENDEINIYLCENYACRQPVSTMVEFREVLHS